MTEQQLHKSTAREPRSADGAVRPPLSCYIRTLNEERRIADVVRGAQLIADEVILVDCGSKDATLRIAEQMGARVIHQPWLGNGKQKRVGEDAAKHNWLLDLDADEVVPPELAEEIRAIFAHAPRFAMYELPLITIPPFGKPWRNFKIAYRKKLYDKTRVRMPDSAVWDQFNAPTGERVGRLSQPIHHFGIADIEHLVTKVNKGSTVRAREAPLKSKWHVTLRVLFGFPIYFAKEFFVRGLVRAGVYGFSVAASLAFGRWLRDVKMYERHMLAKAHSGSNANSAQ